MSKSLTIPDFYGGITQKSERLRDLNEFEDVLNCDVSIEDGIYKRNPISYLSAMDIDCSSSVAYVHSFVKSETEHYSMVFDGSSVQVFDNSGIERTVTVDPAVDFTYLSSVGDNKLPRDVFNTVTLGDSVLINRKDKIVRMDPELRPDVEASSCYFFIKQAQYGWENITWSVEASGRSYKGLVQTAKSIDDVNSERHVGGSNPTSYFVHLTTSTKTLAGYIMLTVNNLANYQSSPALQNTLCGSSWHENSVDDDGNAMNVSAVKLHGSVVKLFTKNGEPFTNVELRDDLGNAGVAAIWKTVASLDDLPIEIADKGYKLRVAGNKSDLSDDFYVKYVPDGASDNVTTSAFSTSGVEGDSSLNSVGYWRECGGFSTQYKFDYDTLPHALIQRPDGSFLYTRMDGKALEASGTGAGSTLLKPFQASVGTGGNEETGINMDDAANFLVGDAVKFTNLYEPDHPDYVGFPSGIVEGATYYIHSKGNGTNEDVITLRKNASQNADGTWTPFVYYLDQPNGGPNSSVKMEHVEYSQFKFAERDAGDDVSNPIPAFVGNTINDIVLHRNRLAFVSRDAVSLSEFGEFFNFFRVTVQELLDTAPIEVQTTDNTTRSLENAVSFKNNLVVFSKEAQFILQASPSLIPANVSFTLATSYNSDTEFHPFVLGDKLYFSEKKNGKNRLQELREVQFKGNFQSLDASFKIPKLISGRIASLTNNGSDKICIVSEDDLTTIYLYTIKDFGNQRLISSWHRLNFNDIEIEDVKFINNDLYIVALYEGRHRTLYRMNADSDFTQVFLDTKIDSSQLPAPVYSIPNDTTTYTIPFLSNTTGWVAVETSSLNEYVLDSVTDTTIVVKTDTSTKELTFGRNYESKIILSRYFPQSAKGRGAVVNDQLVLDNFAVSFDKTNRQAFDLSSAIDSGNTYVKTYTSNSLDVEDIGVATNSVDYAEMLVQSRNRDVQLTISNNTYVPFNLINFEYLVSEGRLRHS